MIFINFYLKIKNICVNSNLKINKLNVNVFCKLFYFYLSIKFFINKLINFKKIINKKKFKSILPLLSIGISIDNIEITSNVLFSLSFISSISPESCRYLIKMDLFEKLYNLSQIDKNEIYVPIINILTNLISEAEVPLMKVKFF